MLGFNFYRKSVRYVEVGMCRSITSALRTRSHAMLVGVFVNSSVAEINATVGTCGLNLIQLHGDETPEMLDAFHGKAFKAIRLSASISVDESVDLFLKSADNISYPFQKSALRPALLVDAAVKGVYGGSGVTADWSAAAELAKKYPLLLAGGLTPENVSDAVRQVKPWGVDVASGVESRPGVKDEAKMRAFVKAVREVESSEAGPGQIQKVKKKDLEEVLALQKLAYQSEAELNNDFNIPPLTQTLEEIRAEFGQALFLKVMDGGRIIGSVRAHEKDGTCHIGRLIVHPAHQNRGIGSRLLKAIEGKFDCKRFELFTSERSERNMYLYVKLGYREFKRVPLNEKTTLVFLEKFNDNIITS
jgi:phosphoribosylanthranilate isomerase/GNAT superfamily N-acetyltransferase